MKYTVLTLMLLLGFPVLLLAQPTVDPPTPPWQWYSSVAGVVVATGLGVQVLKRALGNVAYANAVPTWLYAVIVSGVLTFLTVQVWHTLPGQLWQTMAQVVFMAGASSGFYEWLQAENITKPLAASAISAGVKVPVKNQPDALKKS